MKMKSIVDFHRGETLLRLANTYPNLPLTVIEELQNSIDAGGTYVLICLDLLNREVIVVDNGNGVTPEKFSEALASVGKGIKSRDSIGRFGLGLISPLNKCKKFTFSSCPVGASATRTWTFEAAVIKTQHHEVTIPCADSRRLPVLPERLQKFAHGDFNVTWRTMVKMIEITADKVVSLVDLDQLESEMILKLGRKMKERGVHVRVALIDQAGREQARDINPLDYTGQPLPVQCYSDGMAGDVVVELFRAIKVGGRRMGKVVVCELDDSYGIAISNMRAQALSSEWLGIIEPALLALSSGYFEGVIKCKNITLHPGRTKFENNDALKSLYLVLADWYEQHGKSLLEDEKNVSREERYQLLGLRSQARLREGLLSRPEFGRLWTSLKEAVTFGRLGDGHVDPENGETDGLDDDPSLRTGPGAVGQPKPRKGGTPRGEPQSEGKDRPGDIPTGVHGPRGRRRQLVKDDSQGLWFAHDWIEGSSRLWEFDFEMGVLTFNVRHPIWVGLDETKGKHLKRNDEMIMLLQEWLALEVLTLLTRYQDPDELELNREILDTKIRPYVELFISSKASR